jgi:hypothetical protein
MTAFLLHASILYYISSSTETLPPTAKTLLICLHLVCTDLLRVKIDEVSLRLTFTMYSIVRTLKDTQSHRLNMDVDHQSLFWAPCHVMYAAVLIG